MEAPKSSAVAGRTTAEIMSDPARIEFAALLVSLAGRMGCWFHGKVSNTLTIPDIPSQGFASTADGESLPPC
jgi:hypothetical protein